jgi:membrane protein required for colicin V production
VILDILTLLLVGAGGFLGYRNGLLGELVDLLHFIIAFFISFYIISLLFRLLDIYLFQFDTNLLPSIVFACSCGATFALLATLGKFLKTEIEYDFPGAWDNIIGGIFGVLKYTIVLSFFYWFIMAYGKIHEGYKIESMTYLSIEKVAYTLTGVNDKTGLDTAIRNFVGVRR